MAARNYRIELYEDGAGDRPVRRWLTEDLDTIEAAALGLAMNHLLQDLGPAIVETRFGRSLGGGLYEFRLDDTVDELLRRLGMKKKRKLARAPAGRMLLRDWLARHPRSRSRRPKGRPT